MALKKIALVAKPEHEGKRIDAVLAEWLPAEVGQEVSKGKVRKLIMAGAVYLNGRRIRVASKALIPGATLEAFVDIERLKTNQTSKDIPFVMDQSRVLFEDKWLIAVDKPAGLPTQPTLDDARDNLYACLKKYMAERDGNPNAYVGLHHRLDRDTSGVVIFTKLQEANAATGALFVEHRVKKVYHALAQRPGIRPGSLTTEWKVSNFLRRAEGKRTRFRSVRSGGDKAETELSVLGDYSFGVWLEARPLTGRTHQIRVHLSEGGMPIIGDELYGASSREPNGSPVCVKRTMLHAKELRFVHPVTGADIKIDSPLPVDFQEALRWVKGVEPLPGRQKHGQQSEQPKEQPESDPERRSSSAT